ncbi:hypothetical protein [Acidovorax sp.]|uniref:hypothetical protein n=1 Tax=Acidovorax sp. TaxID=1872122 RepID=UPI00391F10B0
MVGQAPLVVVHVHRRWANDFLFSWLITHGYFLLWLIGDCGDIAAFVPPSYRLTIFARNPDWPLRTTQLIKFNYFLKVFGINTKVANWCALNKLRVCHFGYLLLGNQLESLGDKASTKE